MWNNAAQVLRTDASQGVRAAAVRKKEQERGKLAIEFEDMLKIAHGKVGTLRGAARMKEVHPNTLKRALSFVSYTEFEHQCMKVKALGTMFVGLKKQGVKFFAGLRTAWDETSERLRLRVNKDLKGNAASSAWSVLVVQNTLFYGSNLGAGFLEVYIPPLPLIANSSTHIYNAMNSHPFLLALRDTVEQAKNSADTFVE
eukprot:8420931-Pyramimonas_sp.AAC.1